MAKGEPRLPEEQGLCNIQHLKHIHSGNCTIQVRSPIKDFLQPGTAGVFANLITQPIETKMLTYSVMKL